jgi:F-type H+-transporting ATPase subunit gamma
VLDALLPQYVASRIFYAMLEAAAAELASRRRAMKAATDNAGDLLETLTREANNARLSAAPTRWPTQAQRVSEDT